MNVQIVQYVLSGLYAGKIKTVTRTLQSFIDYPKAPDFGYLESVDPTVTVNTHRVDLSDPGNPLTVLKAAIPFNVLGSTISGLPICTATVEDITIEVLDGVLIVNVDLPGSYEVALESPIYLRTTATVIIT